MPVAGNRPNPDTTENAICWQLSLLIGFVVVMVVVVTVVERLTPRHTGNAEHMTSRRITSALAVGVLALSAAACSDETIDSIETDVESAVTNAVDIIDDASEDAVEVAARNFASVQGGQEFDGAGHPLDDELTCEADATNDLTAVEIDCTGTTVDGGQASMTGTTSEFPGLSFNELDGDFVGTVDGAEVFTTERLGG